MKQFLPRKEKISKSWPPELKIPTENTEGLSIRDDREKGIGPFSKDLSNKPLTHRF